MMDLDNLFVPLAATDAHFFLIKYHDIVTDINKNLRPSALKDMFYGSCNTQDMTWHVVNLGFGGFREDFMMSLLDGLTASYNQKRQ